MLFQTFKPVSAVDSIYAFFKGMSEFFLKDIELFRVPSNTFRDCFDECGVCNQNPAKITDELGLS